jgi:serine/threonine protein kinase
MNSETALQTIRTEVNILKALNHPYMVRLIDFKEDAILVKANGTPKRVAYMVLELIKGGELFDYVALEYFDHKICRFYFKQLLHVIHFTHSRGVSHRDLKPENIMLDD